MQAFDSLDRDTLWKLLQHYGIPENIITLIRNTYDGMTCNVTHAGRLTYSFQVKTGVRQGCLLSPFMFLVAIDWIMKTTTKNRRNGIQWTLWSQLDDLDFADDLALLSHSHEQMEEKTDLLNLLMKTNTKSKNVVTVSGKPLEETDCFTYLGSKINTTGGREEDTKPRIQKARVAFLMLSKIWKSKLIKLKTNMRLFNSSVKSVLLYISETWRITKHTVNNNGRNGSF